MVDMLRKFYKYYKVYWVLVVSSIYLYIYFAEFRPSVFRNAEVTYNDHISGGSGRYSYEKLAPYFKFEYEDSLYEGYDNNRSVRDFRIGETIKIYFRESNPQKASIYTSFSFWLLRPEIIWPLLIALLVFMSPLVGRQFIKDMQDSFGKKKD